SSKGRATFAAIRIRCPGGPYSTAPSGCATRLPRTLPRQAHRPAVEALWAFATVLLSQRPPTTYDGAVRAYGLGRSGWHTSAAVSFRTTAFACSGLGAAR